MVEKPFALSGASSVSDLRLMKPLTGRKVFRPFLSGFCQDVTEFMKIVMCENVQLNSAAVSYSALLSLSFVPDPRQVRAERFSFY